MLYIPINSIKHQSFVYTQLKNQTALFLTIQWSISQQNYQTLLFHLLNFFKYYHSGPEWTLECWQLRSTPHSPKLQHYWNLGIRRCLMSCAGHSLIFGVFTPLQRCRWCILQPQPTRVISLVWRVLHMYKLVFRQNDWRCKRFNSYSRLKWKRRPKFKS